MLISGLPYWIVNSFQPEIPTSGADSDEVVSRELGKKSNFRGNLEPTSRTDALPMDRKGGIKRILSKKN